MPDVGWFLGQLSAAPRNLTFSDGWARSRFTDSATRPPQRLLPPTTNWSSRPIGDSDKTDFVASKQSPPPAGKPKCTQFAML